MSGQCSEERASAAFQATSDAAPDTFDKGAKGDKGTPPAFPDIWNTWREQFVECPVQASFEEQQLPSIRRHFVSDFAMKVSVCVLLVVLGYSTSYV
jgi:hypothetical protein